MTALTELPPAVQNLYPANIRNTYEIHEWRNASVVLNIVHPAEWVDLITVLDIFRLKHSSIITGGGNKSKVAAAFDTHLYALGWNKMTFNTNVTVNETSYPVPTHEVDCFKNKIEVEVEWNNKDPFYDRDLNNFRLLFDLRTVDVGIIITRTNELQAIFQSIGRGSSYGASTTHMSKLLPKINGGGAGGCPVIVFGITPALYVMDTVPISDDELKEAERLEEAEAILAEAEGEE